MTAGDCTTCEHYAARYQECRELVGVLRCGRCGDTYRAETIDATRCATCDVLPDPTPVWEILDPTTPPAHCPGWAPIPVAEPPAANPKPPRGRKRKRKPNPQMEMF